MIGQQRKISSFFAPAVKRTLSTNIVEVKTTVVTERNDLPGKKLRLSQSVGHSDTETEKEIQTKEEEKTLPSSNLGLSLSPEQRARLEVNRVAARKQLQEKENSVSVVCPMLSNMGSSWRKALASEFNKPYFKALDEFVSAERQKLKVYPPENQVFTWTQMCSINDVKVVILGQDPYHGAQQAHGLCFSVQQGIQPPPSLVNIFKELESDIEGFKNPGHGNLIGWARQGVLLLNACLTVRDGQANSHAGKGWEQFTDATISWLNKNLSGVVFMLWGAYAQKKGTCIDKKKHHILQTVHPSPLSAHRGFLGCKHFSKCNALLKKDGKTPIDWNRLPPN